jgi:hypothetical protein
MAEIEHGPLPALALVRGDDPRLGGAAALDGLRQNRGPGRAARARCSCSQCRNRIADQAVLDHLGEARGVLPRRQRLQHLRIDEHGPGLVEGADHVLAQGMVDRGLAADAGIHLRQQGGGHLQERHAALVAGRGKAGHVAHHAAAEGQQGGAAVVLLAERHIEDALQYCQRLVLLAVRQNHLGHAVRITEGGAQAGRYSGATVSLLTMSTCRRRCAAQQGAVVEQPGADVNRIAALAEIDVRVCSTSAVYLYWRGATVTARGCAAQRPGLLLSVSTTRSATSRYRGSRIGEQLAEHLLRDHRRSAAGACDRARCAAAAHRASRAGRSPNRARPARAIDSRSTTPPPVASTCDRGASAPRSPAPRDRGNPLALDIENPGDIRTGARSISWSLSGSKLQGTREEAADSGLAGPHGADEENGVGATASAGGLSRGACRRGSAA